jgi:hypothetical protein
VTPLARAGRDKLAEPRAGALATSRSCALAAPLQPAPRMLYRSLVLGLVAACFILLVRNRERVHVVHVHDHATPAAERAQLPVIVQAPPVVIHDAAPLPPQPVCAGPRGNAQRCGESIDPPATLIDVSSAVPADRLLSLVTLAPTERIASYEDHHNYIDIEVRGVHGDRRVLMLMR